MRIGSASEAIDAVGHEQASSLAVDAVEQRWRIRRRPGAPPCRGRARSGRCGCAASFSSSSPHQVADRIVDHLEAVEVEEQHREALLGVVPCSATAPVLQRPRQVAAVGQAGQRVVQGVVLELVLDALAHRDLVAQFADGVGQFAGARRDALLEFGVGQAQRFVGLPALSAGRRGRRRSSAAPGRAAL